MKACGHHISFDELHIPGLRSSRNLQGDKGAAGGGLIVATRADRSIAAPLRIEVAARQCSASYPQGRSDVRVATSTIDQHAWEIQYTRRLSESKLGIGDSGQYIVASRFLINISYTGSTRFRRRLSEPV